MKILIATDGSKFSAAAVEKVCQIMENSAAADIRVVSVYEMPLMTVGAPYTIPAGYNHVLEIELRETAQAAVSAVAEKLRACFSGGRLELTTQFLCGPPKQAIVEEAEEWGADLIVVGSHGYGFWERVFLGSVSNAVVHHAPCSVMVVRM